LIHDSAAFLASIHNSGQGKSYVNYFGNDLALNRRVKLALVISIIFSVTPGYSQVDAKAIVAQSIQNYERDWKAAGWNWAYTETDVTQSDDTKQVEVSEVIPLAGTPFERLVRKDGRPLTASEQRKEDRKYQKVLRERQKETPGERAERIRKYDEERAFVRDVPNAYDFKLVGSEMVDGRPAWVISMTPRMGFEPSAPHGAVLEHIEGTLWIDKEDVQWAKAEAHVIDTISIGWILARVGPGTRFTVEQTRVENGLWMPRRVTISGAAHVMLVYSKSINEEMIWSGYHKDGSFAADTRGNDAVGIGSAKAFR
jgi:hypothetical protein